MENMLLTLENANKNNFEFTTNDTIILFIFITATLGTIFGLSVLISSYPAKFMVRLHYKNPINDIEKYFFYYQKATAYRMLFSVHILMEKFFNITGSTMTFITVYCAIDKNDYILLCSLINAICQVATLSIPSEKYMKIYVQAARKLEYKLNKHYEDESKILNELETAYEEAEKIIEDGFV